MELEKVILEIGYNVLKSLKDQQVVRDDLLRPVKVIKFLL
jgi:hypothetical protein